MAKAALDKATKNGKRAVIYARYSSTGQTEQSIEGQLRECYQTAKELGLNVVKEYIDRALTGTNDSRPQFRKMINDSAFGTFDVIITWKMDRFARNRTDSALYKKILKDNGVKVVYSAENIPEGNEGVILESVLEGLAEYYSLDLAQKTIRGKKESIRKGKHIGGSVLYGYKLDKDKYYLIDESTAPIIRKIFKDYLSGARTADIAIDLNNSGMLTRASRKWTSEKIIKVLNNHKYAGEYKAFDIECESSIPAIIDKETFEAVQMALAKNQRAGGRYKAKYKYMLSGKVKCGLCGRAMCGSFANINRAKTKFRTYYRCLGKKSEKGCDSGSIHGEKLEKVVIDNVMKIVLHDDFVDKIANKILELNQLQDDSTGLINAFELELKEIATKIDNIMTAIEEGLATQRMKTRISELEAREEQLNEQIKFERMKINKTLISKEQIIYWFSMFKNGDIHSTEFVEQLIELFIDKVVVFPDKIDIYCNYLDKSQQQMLLFSYSDVFETETLHVMKVSKYKTLKIGKSTVCLEISR